MPLNSSGPISIGGSTTGQSINLELGRSATAQSNLNETALRTLAGVPSGAISLSNFYGKSNFTPTTVTYNSGSGTETAPTGASNVRIRVYGAGGGGGRYDTGDPRGGGGGAFVESNYSISGGQTISYIVGAGGAGAGVNNSPGIGGGFSRCSSGTKTITQMDAGGGVGGGNLSGGNGGNASGGNSQDVNGGDGVDYTIGGFGGDCLGTGGGIGGNFSNGSAPGGGGASNVGASGFNGAAGRVEFYYT